jgi:hypothetical protein
MERCPYVQDAPAILAGARECLNRSLLMRIVVIAATALSLFALPYDAPAQERIALDVRGVLASATGDLADADVGTGFGFGATLALRVQEHLHLYGGWDWLHFGADEAFAGGDADFEETGYTFGLRYEHQLRAGWRTGFRLEGCGTYKHVEVEDGDGDPIADSDHKLGFELGAGLVTPLGDTWRVTTMGRFRSLSPEFDVAPATTSGTFSYVALEIGLTRRF